MTIRNGKKAWQMLAASALLAVVPTSALLAQDSGRDRRDDKEQTKKRDTTGDDAREVVSQPVRDVGIERTKIPPLLVEVSQDPYGTYGTANCRQLTSGITALNGVLGPDFTASPQAKKTNIAKAGGAAVVNSLIPFRGLVREVSGAGPADRRLEAAIDAGLARRGYLRGLAVSRGCKVPAGGVQTAKK